MTCVLVDIGMGNLHSAQKAFERMAQETGAGPVAVSARPEDVARAERVVLPGDGAFPACRRAIAAIPGMEAALAEAFGPRGRPSLGICVGMQMLATTGTEFEIVPGFDVVPGTVGPIEPSDPALKVPHMGWNDLIVTGAHPLLEGIATGDHAYFVHSHHMRVDAPADRLAHAVHGVEVAAVVARGNVAGTQFHPEKSQRTGLRLIANFLRWRP